MLWPGIFIQAIIAFSDELITGVLIRFGQVRLESFKGGHALSEAGLKGALSWFIDLYTKDSVETK